MYDTENGFVVVVVEVLDMNTSLESTVSVLVHKKDRPVRVWLDKFFVFVFYTVKLSLIKLRNVPDDGEGWFICLHDFSEIG